MAIPKPLVLVFDEDRGVRRLVGTVLRSSAFRVVEAAARHGALVRAKEDRPDVMVVDLAAGDPERTNIIGALHDACCAPILVLSASAREHDKVQALEAGADDYVTKPFGCAELIARVRVALRRGTRSPQNPTDSAITVGDLRIDLARRMVFVDGAEIRLTLLEYRVFATLMKNAGAVVTQKQLLYEVWGADRESHVNYLREYVHQLRRKLEKDPTRPRYLITEPAVGYRIRNGV